MKKLILLSILCLTTSIYSQSKLKKANQLFETMHYSEAAKAYENYIKTIEHPTIETVTNLADSYYYIDDNRNALKWYQQLHHLHGEHLTDVYYIRYIETLKNVTDYEQAAAVTKEYLAKKDDPALIARYVRQQQYMDSLQKTKPLYTIKNIDNNTTKSDFGATFYGDKIIFSSARDTMVPPTKLYSWNKQPYLNLYQAERNTTDGNLFNSTPFLAASSTNYHSATLTFSADLQTVYYTTNTLKKNKLVIDEKQTNHFQILKGTIVNGVLQDVSSLYFNSKEYSVGHPSLSEDGTLLFFTSDMPGGYGGSDLYYVSIALDGTIGAPKNLGAAINTAGNEMFPFVANKVLYFSSNGHFGWGGLDLYESRISEDLQFSEPKNLGQPVNSQKDDFAYIIDSKEQYGYFSSNRGQGKGDDDIYYFTKSKPECNQLISGKVIDAKTKKPLADVTVDVKDVFDALLTTVQSNQEGLYKVTLPCDQSVQLVASKKNFSQEKQPVVLTSVPQLEHKNINFELSNYDDLVVKENGYDKVAINPIFFDYDKATITPASTVELDKVVSFLNKFPTAKIKIESHTDSRGSDLYNLKLSNSRAKSTEQYLLSKGIDSSRIESVTGFGETRLLNKCSNGVKCTDEEHFRNRRSDFIILSL